MLRYIISLFRNETPTLHVPARRLYQAGTTDWAERQEIKAWMGN